MDQNLDFSEYTCVLLAAGYGSRISGLTDLPKSLLKINHETLLERNFSIWKKLGIKNINLVLGYKKESILKIVDLYKNEFNFNIILNENYQTLGNTYSLYVGIKDLYGPCLIFDADLIYNENILIDFLQKNDSSSILLGPGSIDDIECAKALIDTKGFIRKTIDKRAITKEELMQYHFAGEAIGILKFSTLHTKKLAEMSHEFLKNDSHKLLNWEHLLNDFLISHDIKTHLTKNENWVEIDTPDDFYFAVKLFGEIHAQ